MKIAKEWLRILKAPEAFALTSAPVAGFLLAKGSLSDGTSLFFACAASAFAFMAGSVADEIADSINGKADSPLIIDSISPMHARMAAGHLAFFSLLFSIFAGMACATVCAAMLLAYGLHAFNARLREWIGSELIAFGAAASALLGSAAVEGVDWKGFSPEIFAAAVVFFYCFGAERVAEDLLKPLHARHGRKRFLAGAIACAALSFAIALLNALHVSFEKAALVWLCVAGICSLALIAEAVKRFHELAKDIATKRRLALLDSISRLFLFAMAAFCAAAGSIAWTIVLFALIPVHNIFSKWLEEDDGLD